MYHNLVYIHDYQSAICSTENLTKTVKRLPETLRKSFYKATKDVSFVSGDVTLIEFEWWLDNRLKEYFNLIANITAKQEEKPKVPPYKANTNAGTITDGRFTDKQFVGYVINHKGLWSAKILLRKTCKKRICLNQ